MAISFNTDGEYARRSSIPSGGAGTLTDGAFTNSGAGVWCYVPGAAAGNTYGGVAGGKIIHLKSSAREVTLAFDNTFGSGTADDPLLQVIFDSGVGSTAFSSQPPRDTWCYFVLLDNSTDGQIAAWRELGSDTWNSEVLANSNAGSQYTNTLTFGSSDAGGVDTLYGRFAYARARYATGQTLANWLTYSKSDVTASGDWGFWPMVDNADTGDDSGNARDLTFNGAATETSPTLDGASGGNAARAMLHYGLRRRA